MCVNWLCFGLEQRSYVSPFFRCGFSRGPGLPPSLGHAVLDELHHLHHHQTNCGPGTSRGLESTGRGHSLGGRPSACPGPGWVSKVSSSTKSMNSLSKRSKSQVPLLSLTVSKWVVIPQSLRGTRLWLVKVTASFSVSCLQCCINVNKVTHAQGWSISKLVVGNDCYLKHLHANHDNFSEMSTRINFRIHDVFDRHGC